MPSEATIQKLKKCQQGFETCFSKGDVTTVPSLYDPEAVVVEVGKSSAYGKEAILALFKDWLKESKYESETIKQEFYGDDDYPVMKGTVVMTSESTGHKMTVSYTEVFRRHGETYLLWHDEFKH